MVNTLCFMANAYVDQLITFCVLLSCIVYAPKSHNARLKLKDPIVHGIVKALGSSLSTEDLATAAHYRLAQS